MGFIPNEIIRQVLDRSDIVDTIAAYIPLKRAGHNFKALCPFHHEKTPSFVVNPQKQIYHCFGCGAGGNAISFVMAQEHVEFPEAVRVLAQKAGVEILRGNEEPPHVTHLRQQLYKVNELAKNFFHQNLLSHKSAAVKEARTYLKQRGLDLAAVKKFEIGFASDRWNALLEFLKSHKVTLAVMEKAGLIVGQSRADGFYDRFRSRIMFPISDAKGRCVAFGGRSMDTENTAKYINSPETPVYTKGQHLYGLAFSKDDIVACDAVIVVEGYLDFITPFQAGIRNVVASLGTALTLEQIRRIRRYTQQIIMLFDADPAGESAMIRSLDLLIEEGMNVRVATLDEGEDPDSFVRKYGKEKFQQRITQAHSLFDFKLDFMKARYPLGTVEDRAAVSSAMLSTIVRFPNEVIKSEYIKKLAGAMAVSQEALLREMTKLGRPVAGEIPASSPRDEDDVRFIAPAEKNLLRLMLEDPGFIPLTQEQVRADDFQSETVRLIITKIFELFKADGAAVLPVTLTSYFDDHRIIRTISALMATEDMLAGDKQKIHADCISRLKQNRLKNERQRLSREIGMAQAEGDALAMEKLLKQYNQLIKR